VAQSAYRREDAWRRRAAANAKHAFYLDLLGAHLARETSGRVALTPVSDAEFERCRAAVEENCREGWVQALPPGLGGVEVGAGGARRGDECEERKMLSHSLCLLFCWYH
jgi:hypothetical protein